MCIAATIVWVGLWLWSYVFMVSAGQVGATEVRSEEACLLALFAAVSVGMPIMHQGSLT